MYLAPLVKGVESVGQGERARLTLTSPSLRGAAARPDRARRRGAMPAGRAPRTCARAPQHVAALQQETKLERANPPDPKYQIARVMDHSSFDAFKNDGPRCIIIGAGGRPRLLRNWYDGTREEEILILESRDRRWQRHASAAGVPVTSAPRGFTALTAMVAARASSLPVAPGNPWTQARLLRTRVFVACATEACIAPIAPRRATFQG